MTVLSSTRVGMIAKNSYSSNSETPNIGKYIEQRMNFVLVWMAEPEWMGWLSNCLEYMGVSGTIQE